MIDAVERCLPTENSGATYQSRMHTVVRYLASEHDLTAGGNEPKKLAALRVKRDHIRGALRSEYASSVLLEIHVANLVGHVHLSTVANLAGSMLPSTSTRAGSIRNRRRVLRDRNCASANLASGTVHLRPDVAQQLVVLNPEVLDVPHHNPVRPESVTSGIVTTVAVSVHVSP